MSKYIICQSFKQFHRAVFSIAHPKYSNFEGILDAPCFARDYLQTGYSDMLDISYLFNNNTLKCIKAKIFSFNQK
jgi:hypothetical protein